MANERWHLYQGWRDGSWRYSNLWWSKGGTAVAINAVLMTGVMQLQVVEGAEAEGQTEGVAGGAAAGEAGAAGSPGARLSWTLSWTATS